MLFGRLLSLKGWVGYFQALLDLGLKKTRERVGAVVLALEPEQERSLPTGLDNIPQDSISTIYQKVNSNDQLVGLLAGFWDRPGPARFGWFLEATASVLDTGGRALVFFPQAQVVGMGLEERFRELRQKGAVMTRLKEPPRIEPRDQGLGLSFFDPLALARVRVTVDRLIWDPPLTVPAEAIRLAELMGLAKGPEGWPRPDNVLFPAPRTSRVGILTLGGPSRLQEPFLEQELDLLADHLGTILHPQESSPSAVSLSSQRGFCAECLTCLRICPVKAVAWENGPVALEEACLGCGLCASLCPRSIIRPISATEKELAAHLSEVATSPLVLACERIRAEGLEKLADLVRLPCAGRVSEELLLKLIAAGRKRIVVAGCHPGNCRSLSGTDQARDVATRVEGFLKSQGQKPGQVRFVTLAPHQQQRLEAVLERT